MKTNSCFIRASILTSLVLICVSFSGCNKEKMDEMVADAKKSAGELSEKSGEALKKAQASASEAASSLKEKTKEAVATVKDTASNLADNAGNLVSFNGTAEITLDAPTRFPASYIRLVPFTDGSQILQIKSYKDGQTDSYPSFFLQARVDQSSVDELIGQTVPCRLFAQKKAGGDVWENPTGQLVAVEFKKTEDKLTASFSNAQLVNTANNLQSASFGTFECVPLE